MVADHMQTLRVLGYLLAYPSTGFQADLSECRRILEQERALAPAQIRAVEKLINQMEKQDLLDLQEEYVDLFDRTPSLSLHLFEHVHGDSRDRGQALADLLNVYQEAGLVIAADEMPDYLPLFLEFLSTQAPEAARSNLANAINVLGAIQERLNNRTSPYAVVFDALIDIAGCKPDPLSLQREIKKSDGAPRDNDQIDKEWAEQFAFENTAQTTGLFQKNNDPCPIAQQMLDRMRIGNVSNGE